MGGKRGFETLLRKEAMKKKNKISDNSLAKNLNGRYIKDVD